MMVKDNKTGELYDANFEFQKLLQKKKTVDMLIRLKNRPKPQKKGD